MYMLLRLFSVLILGFSVSTYAGQAYLERFNNFRMYNEHFPAQPSPEFIDFISKDKVLSQRLRSRWLYQLGRNKNWARFQKDYQPSTDPGLQCYSALAKLNSGQKSRAFEAAIPLWLNGRFAPKACDELFKAMMEDPDFDENLITKRIILALEERNIHLAAYLLKAYKMPKKNEVKLLLAIYQDPRQIKGLSLTGIHGDFYLYGLKRLVSYNMDKAVEIWRSSRTKQMLNEEQSQAFLSYITVYKSLRGETDAYVWFEQIKPNYYTPLLLDWQTRQALRMQDWKRVLRLIKANPEKRDPAWVYWQARALEKLSQKEEANKYFAELASQRHYYGFLAGLKLSNKFNFHDERPVTTMRALAAYPSILEEIRGLYTAGKKNEASILLNDFSSELPKHEASALAWWVATRLNWPGKAIYLSNKHELLQHQLGLRFPLSYRAFVSKFSKHYMLPPEFVYAIIRQESAFRSDVVSSAGARGLMQIMPATAKMVTKRDKIRYRSQEALFELKTNINIGTAYLNMLAERFRRHPVLIAAAYNAGPGRVKQWMEKNPTESVDIWIETIPWHETRNYLKNVMAFYLVYQYRLNKKPDLSPILKPLNLEKAVQS